MRAQAMSELFLKFWVEQSELMDWNEKNGGTFPQPFSQESVWMVVDDRKQKPLKSSISTSSVLYLALSVEGGGGNVLPLEFWRTLVRSRFTISGCEIECVQRLMRRKYSDFYIFSLWGGEERYSSLPWRRNITMCLSQRLLASQYWCWCEKQEETKKNRVWQQEMFLITSSRKHYLPSFSLYLL